MGRFNCEDQNIMLMTGKSTDKRKRNKINITFNFVIFFSLWFCHKWLSEMIQYLFLLYIKPDYHYNLIFICLTLLSNTLQFYMYWWFSYVNQYFLSLSPFSKQGKVLPTTLSFSGPLKLVGVSKEFITNPESWFKCL